MKEVDGALEEAAGLRPGFGGRALPQLVRHPVAHHPQGVPQRLRLPAVGTCRGTGRLHNGTQRRRRITGRGGWGRGVTGGGTEVGEVVEQKLVAPGLPDQEIRPCGPAAIGDDGANISGLWRERRESKSACRLWVHLANKPNRSDKGIWFGAR